MTDAERAVLEALKERDGWRERAEAAEAKLAAVERERDKWERRARELGQNGICGKCGGPRWHSVERVNELEAIALALCDAVVALEGLKSNHANASLRWMEECKAAESREKTLREALFQARVALYETIKYPNHPSRQAAIDGADAALAAGKETP